MVLTLQYISESLEGPTLLFSRCGAGSPDFHCQKFSCDTQTRVKLLLSSYVSVRGIFPGGRGHSGSKSFLTSESYLLWSQLKSPSPLFSHSKN